MCGIFFISSKNSLEIPQCLQEFSTKIDTIGGFDKSAGVKLSSQEAAQLIAKDLARDTVLTENDKHKLANVDRLRELQNLINSVKNGQSKKANRESTDIFAAELAILAKQSNISNGSAEVSKSSRGPQDPVLAVLARGPDFAQFHNFTNSQMHFQLFSSVLSLRQPFTEQPLVRDEWILQFNGELYNAESMSGNDTAYIMNRLASELKRRDQSKFKAVATTMSSLEGEFAYVLLDLAQNVVYFGKDSVGKRSLLYELSSSTLSVSSVFCNQAEQATECKGGSMYIVQLSNLTVEIVELNQELVNPVSSKKQNLDSGFTESFCATLHQYLSNACQKRQSTINPRHSESGNARLGILFSGGLDCTVLAAIIGKNFAERGEQCFIDLLTVGFENPRTGLSAAKSPDRVLSEQSWFELSRLFQSSCVVFRLVQVDVAYAEWLAHRERVAKLIYPCATEMDLSIAIAFYFATRAASSELIYIHGDVSEMSLTDFKMNKNTLVTSQSDYKSEAKVLFSGLGADELFGGYSRHENIFHGLSEDSSSIEINSRYAELSVSLAHDIDVIYERNLGRDDRAMSSWGKELRYPYLDEDLIQWVLKEVSPKMKICFKWDNLKTKKGEKRVMKFERKYILRQLAAKLGLPLASKEIKRAIQFGAKSAKMEVGQSKARGTDSL